MTGATEYSTYLSESSLANFVSQFIGAKNFDVT